MLVPPQFVFGLVILSTLAQGARSLEHDWTGGEMSIVC